MNCSRPASLCLRHLASKRAVFINSHSQGEGIPTGADTFKDTGRLVGANLTAALRRHADSVMKSSDFPEADFWTTEEQTVARRALHRNLPAHIFRILPPPAL